MEDVASLLRSVASFRLLSEVELGLVGAHTAIDRAAAGTWIYREGDTSSRLYVVCEGQVEARRGDGAEAFTAARYVKGDAFGDGELWSRAIRETGAFATRETTLLVFPRPATTVEELQRRHPELFVRVLWLSIAEVAGRIRSTNALISTKTPWIRALESLLYTDALTGLPNRRWLIEQLRAISPEEPVALVVLKPDHFKAVNDRYGHEEGDRALEAVAREMRRIVKPPNAVSRLRGDEFAVLLPGIRSEAARGLAVSLLRELERFTVGPAGSGETALGFRAGLSCSTRGAGDAALLADRAARNVLQARATKSELIHG